MARKYLKAASPDVVFSTGGYSAGPVVAAARDIGVPYTIHTSDSNPARSSMMFAKQAAAFSSTFHSTASFVTERSVIRTGQPIRRELREVADSPVDTGPLVFVIGGSQGSKFLNETVPVAAQALPSDIRFLHACGPDHHKSTSDLVASIGQANRYEVVPYLKTEQLVDAYRKATVVIARSGGTLAELALFGLPSVLVPLPNSANDHQLHNAEEFEKMSAATILNQPLATPEKIATAVSSWLSDGAKREVASKRLREWDMPDAAERILKLIQGAA
jgi:UDP-N-acetylglucosamine--N-acetylmuramyl-(pentapeptide) pyrophosphoryl-undecaprenol N-acetylglucosamine transferase